MRKHELSRRIERGWDNILLQFWVDLWRWRLREELDDTYFATLLNLFLYLRMYSTVCTEEYTTCDMNTETLN